MARKKNTPLNPYYFELLRCLAVYKFTGKINNTLTTDEREDFADYLKVYTYNAIERIFSTGRKRRQNFNHSTLEPLCNFVGFKDWDEFIEKEKQNWAENLEGKMLYNLDKQTLQKISNTILIKVV